MCLPILDPLPCSPPDPESVPLQIFHLIPKPHPQTIYQVLCIALSKLCSDAYPLPRVFFHVLVPTNITSLHFIIRAFSLGTATNLSSFSLRPPNLPYTNMHPSSTLIFQNATLIIVIFPKLLSQNQCFPVAIR